MRQFRARPDGVSVTFTDGEANLLASVAGQLVDLLGASNDRAGDPALERLLPDGYRDNPEDAEEFRRFTQAELVDDKVAGARTIIETLTQRTVRGKVQLTLTDAEALAWLRSLNDLRLALAARLGIVDEYSSPRLDDDNYAIYLWLGQVQYSLLRAVDR